MFIMKIALLWDLYDPYREMVYKGSDYGDKSSRQGAAPCQAGAPEVRRPQRGNTTGVCKHTHPARLFSSLTNFPFLSVLLVILDCSTPSRKAAGLPFLTSSLTGHAHLSSFTT